MVRRMTTYGIVNDALDGDQDAEIRSHGGGTGMRYARCRTVVPGDV